MAAKYWIKLYHDILHDPKMGMMSDRLFRRTIQLFLLAGETDQDGELPPISEIAWMFRSDTEQLETEMIELQRLGILSVIDGAWIVTNFSKRQSPISGAERTKRYRKRNECVTIRHTETETDTDIDTDTEEERESDPFDNLSQLLSEMTGILPVGQKDVAAIREMVKIGITRDDISGALQWRKENGTKPARTIWSLLDGIAVEHAKRIQANNASRKNGKIKKEEPINDDYWTR